MFITNRLFIRLFYSNLVSWVKGQNLTFKKNYNVPKYFKPK